MVASDPELLRHVKSYDKQWIYEYDMKQYSFVLIIALNIQGHKTVEVLFAVIFAYDGVLYY